MRVYTVHAPPEPSPGREGKPRRPPSPILIRDAFSWLAFLFSGLWFLANRMWLVFAIYLPLVLLMIALVPEPILPWVGIALQILVGFSARDLLRWTLARHGWRMAGVVVARDKDAAWARIFAERPELARAAA